MVFDGYGVPVVAREVETEFEVIVPDREVENIQILLNCDGWHVAAGEENIDGVNAGLEII